MMEETDIEKRLEKLTEKVEHLSKLINVEEQEEKAVISQKRMDDIKKKYNEVKVYAKNKIYDNPFGYVAGAGLVTGIFGIIAGFLIKKK